MPAKSKSSHLFYDNTWTELLDAGKDFGDLELTVRFIERVGFPEKDERILDIGCGIGNLCQVLYEWGLRKITGIDISEVAIAEARRRVPGVDLRCMSAMDLDFPDDSFDECFAFDVLEHLPDVRRHLEEVRRILVPGGRYLIQTPNILTNVPFETVRRKIVGPGTNWKTFHPSLQSCWGLKRILPLAGFSHVKFVRIPPLSSYKISQMSFPFNFLFANGPWERLPIFLTTNFYVVAMS
ncbi:MAG: class I SAM-dependent methyltransferase [Planctomycetes bacterium]|nr:class I SAM-dependent methyltransferase [Planctomycetota bacterium]